MLTGMYAQAAFWILLGEETAPHKHSCSILTLRKQPQQRLRSLVLTHCPRCPPCASGAWVP